MATSVSLPHLKMHTAGLSLSGSRQSPHECTPNAVTQVHRCRQHPHRSVGNSSGRLSSLTCLGAAAVAGGSASMANRQRVGTWRATPRRAQLMQASSPGVMLMGDNVHNGRRFFNAGEQERGLQLFLDSADLEEWERCLPRGIFRGVTTNPVLLERAGVTCAPSKLKRLLKKALDYPGVQEVMFQAWGSDVASLVHTARALRDLDPARVVVKMPLTVAGAEAAALLKPQQETRICMTACYSQQQALIAAGLKAEYISPYLGKMAEEAVAKGLANGTDGSMNGRMECILLQTTLEGMGSSTRMLVASVRSAVHAADLAAAGCNTFTIPPKVCDELFDVEATRIAAENFQQAADRNQLPEKAKSKARSSQKDLSKQKSEELHEPQQVEQESVAFAD
eukprot:TRINITY_DN5602_c0_g2_i1.p1 TRINITY_DN5602_c0_g2~~TRINITY_DN5602_c0_g2_i1.p1  ORF type:complete len:394 (+),score=72.68 TRINITY_DN5602_c0_g2_i1:79-1260(+)